MAKIKKSIANRIALSDKHLGDEPIISEKSSRVDLIHAYNYYNYHYTHDDAKKFVLEYTKTKKSCAKLQELIRRINKINSYDLINLGWNCKILLNGGKLPEEVHTKIWSKLELLVKKVSADVSAPETIDVVSVVSVQDRISQKAKNIISDLEDQIDLQFKNSKHEFNVIEYFNKEVISLPVAKKIVEYYNPVYEELLNVLKGEDSELKEGYKAYKKRDLRKQCDFIKAIISAATTHINNVKVAVVRKPRKKKTKPAHVLISKLKFARECSDYDLKSVSPTEIIGAQQLWTFDSKKRLLTVFNSIGPVGLTVKGTTILGYDENTSITKKLRKPEVSLKNVLTGGKVVLKKLMQDIKSKEQKAKNRLNSDIVLLRTSK